MTSGTMAVNTENITSGKAVLMKRKLKRSAAISGPQLELVEVEEADVAREVFSESTQPYKKRKFTLHSLPQQCKDECESKVKSIYGDSKIDDTVTKQKDHITSKEVDNSKVYDVSKETNVLTSRKVVESTEEWNIVSSKLGNKQNYKDEYVKIKDVDVVELVSPDREVQMIMDIPEETKQKVRERADVLSEVVIQEDEATGLHEKKELKAVEAKNGKIYNTHCPNTRNEAILQNTDKDSTHPGSTLSDVSKGSTEKDHPHSEKADDLKLKHAVKRSSSCPEGALSSSWNSWPLTTKEETNSFFISHSPSDSYDKGYPSAKKMKELNEFFKQIQSDERHQTLAEEVKVETKTPFPPYRMIAFGPISSDPIQTQDKPDINEMKVTESKARLADNSDQPASNINPMSNLSLPDSDDMDEMVTQVLASDCVKNNQPKVQPAPVNYFDKFPVERKFASTNDPLVTMMSSTGHEDITKHDRFRMDRRRMTNRIAARKCRMKQQEKESQLQEQFQEYESKNTNLNYEVRQLMKIKASLELILIKHMRSKTCKLENYQDIEKVTPESVNSLSDIHKHRPSASEKKETGTETINTAHTMKTDGPGLLKRRGITTNPMLPKLRLLRPESNTTQVQPEKQSLSMVPKASPGVADIKVSESEEARTIMPASVVAETPLTVTDMEDGDAVRQVKQDVTNNTHVSAARHVQPLKVASEKDMTESPKKSGPSSTKAQIKKVSAEQLKKILKKGGKVVSAKDKEGRDISVDQVFGETFKRPYDVKPIVKTSPGKQPVAVAAGGGVADSYKKGQQDAGEGKSVIQNRYIFNQAVAAYAMKKGLNYSSREQILAHVKAKQIAKEKLASDRPVSSNQGSSQVGIKNDIQAVKQAMKTVKQMDEVSEPLGLQETSVVQANSAPAIAVDPTEPLFESNHIPKQFPHSNEKCSDQHPETTQTKQTKFLPKVTLENVQNKMNNHQITKFSLQTESQRTPLTQKMVEEGQRTTSHDVMQNVQIPESKSQQGRPHDDYIVVQQTSTVTTPTGEVLQQAYSLRTQTGPTTSSRLLQNTPNLEDSKEPMFAKQISSVGKVNSLYQPQISHPRPISKSLNSVELPPEASIAVSALLQLKSGISDNREHRKPESTMVSSAIHPGVMPLPVNMASTGGLPPTVLVYPGSMPVLLTGHNQQRLGHLTTLMHTQSGQIADVQLVRASSRMVQKE